ncbi:MAG: hypothetical protein A3G81_20275 [Betaproteobacteria bacterium RIFCSPLOWO2_12_FULL_65_14]|nr:MAG: hypothetical protein A3G81_20275 [Betaproteobacteria bacterium RIFCSPLOWO2_12_FULL_65_14]
MGSRDPADLTFQDVVNILRLIDSAPSLDFELELEGTRLKVRRRAVARPAQPATTPVAREQEIEPMPQRPALEFPNRIDVKPPMAGTFYRAPAPGAAPFVEVERAVRKGEQLGVVEVMKLFTPVLAPCDGTLRAILVENEEFVESDQTLMIIEGSN